MDATQDIAWVAQRCRSPARRSRVRVNWLVTHLIFSRYLIRVHQINVGQMVGFGYVCDGESNGTDGADVLICIEQAGWIGLCVATH